MTTSTSDEKKIETESSQEELSTAERNELIAQARRRAARAKNLVSQVGGKALYICF